MFLKDPDYTTEPSPPTTCQMCASDIPEGLAVFLPRDSLDQAPLIVCRSCGDLDLEIDTERQWAPPLKCNYLHESCFLVLFDTCANGQTGDSGNSRTRDSHTRDKHLRDLVLVSLAFGLLIMEFFLAVAAFGGLVVNEFTARRTHLLWLRCR